MHLPPSSGGRMPCRTSRFRVVTVLPVLVERFRFSCFRSLDDCGTSTLVTSLSRGAGGSVQPKRHVCKVPFG